MNSLRFPFAFVFALFVLASSALAAFAQVYPPGSRIGLVPPPGMTISQTFQGFEDRARGAAIVLSELSAQSFDRVAQEFEPEAMKAGGMEEISRETLPLQRGDARLVVARRVENGLASRKWALLTRAAGMTVIVLITLPEAARDAYPDEGLRAALSSLIVRAKLSSDEMSAVLPYRLAELGGFRMLRATPDGTAVLTLGPNDTTLPVEQPYFLVAPRGAEPPQASERALFAQRILMTFLNRPNVRIVSAEPIRFGDAQGHEIIAESIDDRTKDPLMIVQWLRFGAGGTLQMFGIARKDQWADVLPRMRILRNGFERK